MRLRFKATHVVLAMLCVMYFITYVDRVNIGTAASGEVPTQVTGSVSSQTCASNRTTGRSSSSACSRSDFGVSRSALRRNRIAVAGCCGLGVPVATRRY